MLFCINTLRHERRIGTAPRCVLIRSRRRGLDRIPKRGRLQSALNRAGVAGLLLALLATPVWADLRIDLAQARHDLAISEQVLERVSGRANVVRSDPATTPEQRRRLDIYLSHVRDLVERNRKRVKTLEHAVEAMPNTTAAIESGGVGAATAATNAEEVAALDAKLSGSLADFDQLLLEEARKARARAPSRASAHSSGAGSDGAGSNGGGAGKAAQKASGNGSGTAGESQSSEASENSTSSRTGPGSPGGRIDGPDPGAPGATAAVPPDVGDGSDDDIVARQIRRAAEAETDPELRAKLWDEYRKYKEGTKG